MDWDAVDRDREALTTTLAEAMKNTVLEINSETHSQYNEVPFWILVAEGTNRLEVVKSFVEHTKEFRAHYPTLSHTLSLHEPDFDRQLVRMFEFYETAELETISIDELALMPDDEATTLSFDESVFKTLYGYKAEPAG